MLAGGDGADRLEGGAGTDSLQAGGGDDALFADDGLRESVACGAGADTAELDAVDDAWADCETTQRSEAGRAAPTPSPTNTTSQPRAETTTTAPPANEPAAPVGASPAGGTFSSRCPAARPSR